MQLFVLLMMMALLAHGMAGPRIAPLLDGWRMVGAVLGPYALIAVGLWAACWRARRKLECRPEGVRQTLNRLDRLIALSRPVLLGLLLADLYALGWLRWLRLNLGEWVLVNDVIAIAPVLGTVVVGWWAYYPIDRRMRQAALAWQLEDGSAGRHVGTRWQYVLSQVRHQLLLLLVPLLALLGWTQCVQLWIDPRSPLAGYEPVLTMVGGAAVFLTAPLMIRYVWDTVPLPEGAMRTRLLELCRAYGVRIRQLLLWRTYGGMINGAVMGLFGSLRYILLTDGLIERLNEDQVEAVMAHELGHIRRHHMPWMVVCAIALLALVALGVDALLMGGQQLGIIFPAETGSLPVTDGIALAAVVGAWGLLFGYVSRRFERQADTFAVQHLSHKYPDPELGPEVVSERAVRIFAESLMRVAELNHHPPRKRSWRHGSIAWRVAYLHRLAGTPIDRCPIDRRIRHICRACAAILVMVVAIEYLMAL